MKTRRKSETLRFTRRTRREIVPVPQFYVRVEVAVETITVASTRVFALTDTEILIGSAVVIAAVVWMVFFGLKHFRNRHHTQPRV